MPSSISVALASPAASTKKASLIIGGKIRLTTKPGPHLTVIGVGPRAQQLRGCFGVIEPGAVAADRLDIVGIQQLGVQHRKRGAHRLAQRRKSTVGLAGCGSHGIYAASLSRLRPPGPKAMT